ncbi:MAG: hypothetical protein ABSD98_10645 [Candidatus Korobacteraceae bacterium]
MAMVKYIAAFIVVLGLAVYIARQDESSANNSAAPATAPNKQAVAAEPDENHPQQNIGNTERNTPGWYGFFRWPNGTTTWAIILTLLAIAEQTRETAKAAKATRDSIPHQRDAAEAALLNAKAVINAERAWLTVKIQKDPNSPPFPIENFINVLNNRGRTPAVVISIHIQYEFVSTPDLMPVPPVYKWQVSTPERMFVVGESDLPIGVGLDPKKQIFVQSVAGKFLVWYGRIIYEDVFGEQAVTRRQPHETRWCYAWIAGEKRFAICGPEEYNRNT